MSSSQGAAVRLSARDLDVLRLMAEGASNTAICTELLLAPKTVEAQVRSIYAKLGLNQTQESNRRVLAVRWFLRSRSPRSGLPPLPRNGLVGRDRDLRLLGRRVAGPGFVTIVGPGGVGKSRLALELAHRDAERRSVVYIELSMVDELSARTRVLDAFGVEDTGPESSDRLLRGRLAATPYLVVLDNVEHVADAVRDLVPALTSSGTALVLTSREALGSRGEQVWPLAPLSAHAATVLLRERMEEVAGQASPAAADLASWSAALGGLPLALEVAAAQLKPGHGDQPRRISSALSFLSGAASDQSSLERLLGDAIAGLTPEARELAHRLSVFPVATALTSIAQIAGGAHGDSAVAQLLDAALVEIDASGCRMLEPVRQHVLASMTPAEHRGADRVLVDWTVGFTALAEVGLRHDPRIWRAPVAAAASTIDAAIGAAVARGSIGEGLRIARGVTEFWAATRAATAYRRIEPLLARVDEADPVDAAWGMVCAAHLAGEFRDRAAVRRWCASALQLLGEEGDPQCRTVAHYLLANDAQSTDQLEASVVAARTHGLPEIEAWALMRVARDSFAWGGDAGDSISRLERVLRLAHDHRLPQVLAYARLLRAEILLRAAWRDGLDISRTEVDQLLLEVAGFNEDIGGAVQRCDHFVIAVQAALHAGRQDDARRAMMGLLEWAPRTDDRVIVSESLVCAAVVLDLQGHEAVARDLAERAGPAFLSWVSADWVPFTTYAAPHLTAVVTGSAEPVLDAADFSSDVERVAALLAISRDQSSVQ